MSSTGKHDRAHMVLKLAIAAQVLFLLPTAVESMSLGRLFPPSRSRVRGTFVTSQHTSNAVKQAAALALASGGFNMKDKQEEVPTTKAPTKYPVTNSPIFYIRLPPNPYVYVPNMGYISPPINNFNFMRPGVNFLTNGKPIGIYQLKAQSAGNAGASHSQSSSSSSNAISSMIMKPTEVETVSSKPKPSETVTLRPWPPYSQTPTPVDTEVSTLLPESVPDSIEEPTDESASAESPSSGEGGFPWDSVQESGDSAEAGLSTSARPPTGSSNLDTDATEEGRPTDSPITWLKGPYFFNGRPSQLLFFNSPYVPSKPEKLSQAFGRPRIPPLLG